MLTVLLTTAVTFSGGLGCAVWPRLRSGQSPDSCQGGSGWLSEQCLLQRAARRWHSCPGVGSPRPWRCSEPRGCGTEGWAVGTGGGVEVSEGFFSLSSSVILCAAPLRTKYHALQHVQEGIAGAVRYILHVFRKSLVHDPYLYHLLEDERSIKL